MDLKRKASDNRSKPQSKEIKISPSLPEKKFGKATKTVPGSKNASSAICEPSSSKGILSGKHMTYLPEEPSLGIHTRNSSAYGKAISTICKTPVKCSMGSSADILQQQKKNVKQIRTPTEHKNLSSKDSLNNAGSSECVSWLSETPSVENTENSSGYENVTTIVCKTPGEGSTGSGTGILHLETKPSMTCTLHMTPGEGSKREGVSSHADQKEMNTEDMKKCDEYVCESSSFHMLQQEDSITGKSVYDLKFDEEPISTFSTDKNVPSTLLKSITGNSVGSDGSGEIVLHSAQKKTRSNDFRKFAPKKPWDNRVGYRKPEKRPLSSSLCKAKSDDSINSTGSSTGMSHPHKKSWDNNYRNSGGKKNSATSLFGSEGGDKIRSTESRASASNPHKKSWDNNYRNSGGKKNSATSLFGSKGGDKIRSTESRASASNPHQIPWDNYFRKSIENKKFLCSIFNAENENDSAITGSDVCVSCYRTKKAWRDMTVNIAGNKNLLPVNKTSSQMSNWSTADKIWSPCCCSGKKRPAKYKHHADSEINLPGKICPLKVIKGNNIYQEPLRPVSLRDPKLTLPHHVGYEEPLRPVSLRDPKLTLPHHVGYEEPLRPVSVRDPEKAVPHHVGYEEPLRPVSQKDPNAVLQQRGVYNDVPRPLCTRGIVLTIMDDSGFDKIRPMCERASTNEVKYGVDYVDIPRPMMDTRTCNLKTCRSGDAYVDKLRPMCTRASGYVKKIPPKLDDRNVNKPHIFAPGPIEEVKIPDRADYSSYKFPDDIWNKTFQERRRAGTKSTLFDAPGPNKPPPPRKPECNPLTMVGYTQRQAPRPPAERQYRNVITGEDVGALIRQWDPQAYIHTPSKRQFSHGDHL